MRRSWRSLLLSGALVLGGSVNVTGCGGGGFGPGGSNVPLTPATNFVGTWTTPAEVTIFMTSDGCGAYARYNSTPVAMEWVITEIDANHVDVEMYATHIGTTTQIGSHCGSPSVLHFPLYLHGVVSSSNLRLVESIMAYDDQGRALGLVDVEVGNLNLTGNNMTGTLSEMDCPVYCAGYETDPQTCILTK